MKAIPDVGRARCPHRAANGKDALELCTPPGRAGDSAALPASLRGHPAGDVFADLRDFGFARSLASAATFLPARGSAAHFWSKIAINVATISQRDQEHHVLP